MFCGHIWSNQVSLMRSWHPFPFMWAVQTGSVRPVNLWPASAPCLHTAIFVIEEYIRPGSQTVPQRRQLARQIRCRGASNISRLDQQQTRLLGLESSRPAVGMVQKRWMSNEKNQTHANGHELTNFIFTYISVWSETVQNSPMFLKPTYIEIRNNTSYLISKYISAQ